MKIARRLAALLCFASAGGMANAAPPFDPVFSAAMAATLRDMIVWPRIAEYLSPRIYLTPEIIGSAFSPQSDWGREQLADWTSGWQKALDQILNGLDHRGEMAEALSPAGLKIPMLSSIFKTAPDLAHIDRLMMLLDLPMCDQDTEIAQCYLVLQLRQDPGARATLKSIRIERPDGVLLEIPGKVQQ